MFRYRLIRLAMHIVKTILLGRLRIFGRENIPIAGPYIVVLNHTSVADTPILLLAFPLMKWRFFAVEKWRSHPIYGPIMAWLGAIYVKRGEPDLRTLRDALASLEQGTVFGLAPEGTRSRDGALMKAHDGASYLAVKAQVPILPVGLVNSDVLFKNAKKLRRTTLEIHIGRPFMLRNIGRRPNRSELEALTTNIMVQIASLLPPSYRGHYENSPALAALLAGEDPWPYCLSEVDASNPGG